MTCKYIIYDKGCIYSKLGKRDSKEKKMVENGEAKPQKQENGRALGH